MTTPLVRHFAVGLASLALLSFSLATSATEAPSDVESLAPTASDMAKAKADHEHGKVTPKNNQKRTEIEAVRDQDNRITEYVVTPGMTHIPYSMSNEAERPIDTTPGSNNKGSLGNTKQIKFGF